MRPGSSTDPRLLTRIKHHAHPALGKLRIWVLVDEYADDGSIEGLLIGTRQLMPNGEWSRWHDPPWDGDEFHPTQILDVEFTLPLGGLTPEPPVLTPGDFYKAVAATTAGTGTYNISSTASSGFYGL